MAKKKKVAEAVLKEPKPGETGVGASPPGGAIVPEGYGWCPTCQVAYQGEQCPGCSPQSRAEDPDTVLVTEDVEAPPESRPETCKEYLRCRLSAEERDDLGAKMAEAQMRITELKEAKKAVMAQYTSDIAAEEETMNSLARRIFNGFEMRTVECQVTRDYENKWVITTRMDTGEIVKRRDMKLEELQQRLDFEAAGPAGVGFESLEPPPPWDVVRICKEKIR